MTPEYYLIFAFFGGAVFGYLLRERTGWVNTIRIMRKGILTYEKKEEEAR